ncbi:hypothetical protein BaRGS_00024566, partial [Batillaria attramentaria]
MIKQSPDEENPHFGDKQQSIVQDVRMQSVFISVGFFSLYDQEISIGIINRSFHIVIE